MFVTNETAAAPAMEPAVEIEPLASVGLLVSARSSGSDLSLLPVATLRAWVKKHRLVLLGGFWRLGSPEALARYAALWGELMQWPFGTVLELFEHEAPSDHIFDNSCVPYHWDGMYKPFIPVFQIFQCVKAPEAG